MNKEANIYNWDNIVPLALYAHRSPTRTTYSYSFAEATSRQNVFESFVSTQ